MTTKHSPAPWKEVDTDEGELIVEMGKSHSVFIGNLEDTCGECHANARLIATAPELLETCQRAFYAMLNLGNAMNWPVEISQSYADVMNELKAVIAKAKGMDTETTK